MYQYKAHINEVIDGDSFKSIVDLGFHMYINVTLRLLEIDTPEKFNSHKKGLNEKELGMTCKYFAKYLLEGKDVIIETLKPDSFGRVLCHLWFDKDGEQINIVDYYNELGINKLSDTYDSNKILAMKDHLKEIGYITNEL